MAQPNKIEMASKHFEFSQLLKMPPGVPRAVPPGPWGSHWAFTIRKRSSGPKESIYQGAGPQFWQEYAQISKKTIADFARDRGMPPLHEAAAARSGGLPLPAGSGYIRRSAMVSLEALLASPQAVTSPLQSGASQWEP